MKHQLQSELRLARGRGFGFGRGRREVLGLGAAQSQAFGVQKETDNSCSQGVLCCVFLQKEPPEAATAPLGSIQEPHSLERFGVSEPCAPSRYIPKILFIGAAANSPVSPRKEPGELCGAGSGSWDFSPQAPQSWRIVPQQLQFLSF